VRALVTGGAGFIGSHITDRLLRDGWTVSTLDDLSTGTAAAIPREVELDEVDVASSEAASVIARRAPDVVIHCAAQVSVARSMTDPDEDWRVNVLGTRQVIDGTRGAGARVVFLSSGGAIYGETDGASEDTLPAPKSYYATHKYVAERYLEFSGVSYANARLANVYGPGQRTDLEGGVVAIFANALRSGGEITVHGSGSQSRDFVHVSDVAEAVSMLAGSSRRGTWNIGTGLSVTVRELLSMLEGTFGAASRVIDGPPRDGDVRSSRLIVDRIRSDFGWTPRIELPTGLRMLSGERA
jgi:UDP-glucose 4-epimerase